MPLVPSIAALVAIASSLAWSLRLTAEPTPFAAGPGALLAVSLLTMTLIALTGLLLARSRWSLWLLVAIAAAQVALAVAIDGRWVAVAIVVALTQTGLAAAMARRWTGRSSEGPPPLAVVLLLALVGFPALVAASNADRISAAAVLGSTLVVLAAVLYARSGVMALWAMRVLAPVGAALAAASTPLPATAGVLAAGIGLSVLSWSPTIRRAATPLLPLRSPGYRIPPELAPREILDAAGLDEQGRRL